MDGSESKRRAMAWPYPKHKAFEETLQAAAAAWFQAKGHPVNRRSPYILDSRQNWPRNILHPQVAGYVEQERARRQAAGNGFALHKYIHHGLSSQAMLLNLVGPLVVRQDLAPLQEALAAKGVTWPSGPARAVFEVEDREVFNENYGQPTSIDLVVKGDAGAALYVEAKLIEPGFGGCSVFRQGDCDGRNPVGDLSRCYLHHIGRLYWGRLREHGLLDLLGGGAICPFVSYYQFFRELLFALSCGGRFVLLCDERSPSFACDGPMGQRGAYAFLAGRLPQAVRSAVKGARRLVVN